MLRSAIISAVLLFSTLTLLAQAQEEPVVWNFSLGVSGDVHAVLAEADVAEGWFVYSQFVEDGGPIATELDLTDTPGIELRGEPTEEGKALSGYDEMFEMEIVKYADQASFTQTFALPAGATKVDGTLKFMACTKKKCLPPRTVSLSLPVQD